MITKGYVTYAGSNLFGGKKLFSFRVGTEDKFFGTGMKDPGLEKNNYIEFEYTEYNGRFNVDPAHIKHIAREESSQSGVSGQASGSVRQGAKGGGSNEYWEARFQRDVDGDAYRKGNDTRIQYQSARNAAISVVDVLLRERVLKLADGAKADNVAVVMGKIMDLTDEFFDRCSNVSVTTSVAGADGDVDPPFDSLAKGGLVETDKQGKWV